MAETALNSSSVESRWLADYMAEYVRNSGFLPYMGRSSNSVIMTKYELQSEAGKTINMPLITRLKGAGVAGNTQLEGNEESLGNYNYALSVEWRRHGVTVPKSESYKTKIDLWGAAKEMLRTWEAEQLRDDIIDAMHSIDGVDYAASTSTQRNTWVTNNVDRVLFGNSIANYSTTHATALGNCDTTNDKMSAGIISLAKYVARTAGATTGARIRPYKTESGREYYVMFCGARTFFNAKRDTTIYTANKDARERGISDNPIFQDGDLIYDGVIIREVPEITERQLLSGVGASTADVEPAFLCGAQAIGIAWGQEPNLITDMTRDYKFRPGVAVEELVGVGKMRFGTGTSSASIDHGMVTVYTAAPSVA